MGFKTLVVLLLVSMLFIIVPAAVCAANIESDVQTYLVDNFKPTGSKAPQIKVSGKGGLSIKAIPFPFEGDGDAVMVSSDGKNLLMDTYISTSSEHVKKWLEDNGYADFDIYISHYHDDHIGNVENLLNDSRFHISTIYLPDPSYMNYKSNDTDDAKGHMENIFQC